MVHDQELMALSAFALENGVVYHTYTCYDRGTDVLNTAWGLLDRAPEGPRRGRRRRLAAPQRRVLRRVRPGRAMLNQMVQYQQLDRTFAALADPTRRAILERLGRGSATISELAEPSGMTLTGLKKHVRVLEDADLVSTEKVGRVRHCSLGPRGLDDIQLWLDAYRRMLDERLDRLGELLERNKGEKR